MENGRLPLNDSDAPTSTHPRKSYAHPHAFKHLCAHNARTHANLVINVLRHTRTCNHMPAYKRTCAHMRARNREGATCVHGLPPTNACKHGLTCTQHQHAAYIHTHLMYASTRTAADRDSSRLRQQDRQTEILPRQRTLKQLASQHTTLAPRNTKNPHVRKHPPKHEAQHAELPQPYP